MKKLIFILMVGSLFSEEPIVTILGKSGIYITGTIKKYEDGKIIIKIFLNLKNRFKMSVSLLLLNVPPFKVPLWVVIRLAF